VGTKRWSSSRTLSGDIKSAPLQFNRNFTFSRSPERPSLNGFDNLSDFACHTGIPLCPLTDFISYEKFFSFILVLSQMGITTFQHVV